MTKCARRCVACVGEVYIQHPVEVGGTVDLSGN